MVLVIGVLMFIALDALAPFVIFIIIKMFGYVENILLFIFEIELFSIPKSIWLKEIKFFPISFLIITTAIGIALFYPALFTISLIKSSVKNGWIFVIFAIVLSVTFIIAHSFYIYAMSLLGMIFVFGAIQSSKSAAILSIILFIYICYKTHLSLTKK